MRIESNPIKMHVRTSTQTHSHTHLKKLDNPKEEMRPSGGVMLLFASTLPLLMLFCANATGDEAALSGAASSCRAFSSSASASNIVDFISISSILNFRIRVNSKHVCFLSHMKTLLCHYHRSSPHAREEVSQLRGLN